MMWLVLQIAAMTVAALSGIFDEWFSKRVGNHPRLFLRHASSRFNREAVSRRFLGW